MITADILVFRRDQSVCQQLQAFPFLLQVTCGAAQGRAPAQGIQVPLGIFDLPFQGNRHGGGHGVQGFRQCIPVRYRQLGGIGGCGGPEVSHIVGNCHIRLVAHRGNHRNLGFIDGIGNPLVIKGPKVLNGAASPAHDQQVRQLIPVGILDGRGDLTGSLRSLYPDGKQPHLGQRITLAQDPQHIMDSGTGGAGNDANGTRVSGQRLLMGRVKQALGGQLLLELLEGGIEVTHTVHGHGSDIQLVCAVPGENRYLTHGDNLHTVLRPEPEPHGISLEHDAFQGAALVLQGKVMMAGGIHLVVADLTLYRNRVQKPVRIHHLADIFVDLADRKHLLCHRSSLL